MSRDIWSPGQYRAYSSHRARPFFELLSRVDADSPAYVVDLGCGPGERTLDLAARWPGAVIEGIDSSPQMITEARRLAAERASLEPAEAGEKPSGGRRPDEVAGRVVVREGTRAGGAVSVGGEAAGEAAGEDAGSGVVTGQGGDAARAGTSIRDVGVPRSGGALRFSVGDLAEWTADRPVDVIFSNAALQWVPEHRRLLSTWVRALTPTGRLAFSMPGNFEGPSHRILRELCGSSRWRDRLGAVNRHNVVGDPAEYFELLSDLGCEVDAWETTYLQILQGPDPVLEWMKGTALRPALDALPEENDREEFLTGLAGLLRDAYPPGRPGTLFPFRRVFVIAAPPATAS